MMKVTIKRSGYDPNGPRVNDPTLEGDGRTRTRPANPDPELVELEAIERERHERSMPSPASETGPVELPAKTLTFRQLLVWMERWAKEHEDGELDMPVVIRLADDDNDEWLCGGLIAVDVDPGCTESDALVLDGSTDVEDA